ncbi:MAG: arginase family protein [Desulfobacter sp.]
MPKIDPEKLERYKKLADKELWDINEEKFNRFYQRAKAEGVELVSNNFNTLGMFRAPHTKVLDGVDIVLAGIPLDIGVPNPRPGTRLAPREVRYWSLDRNMVHYHTKVCPFDICNIIDWGDVEFEKDIYNLDANLAEIEEIYTGFQKAGIAPLSIGGEHTCTYPVMRALGREEPLHVIHLDAHGDTSLNFGGCRVSDATLMQNATVDGVVDPEHTIQIGLRGRGVMRCDFSRDSGMRVVLADEFQEQGAARIVEEARQVVGDGPCYLTIDTDVFDCGQMPGTTLPEPFGLTGREVRDFIRGLRGLNIVGADLMELSPPYDPTGQSACLASGIAFEMLCLLAECRAEHKDGTGITHWT